MFESFEEWINEGKTNEASREMDFAGKMTQMEEALKERDFDDWEAFEEQSGKFWDEVGAENWADAYRENPDKCMEFMERLKDLLAENNIDWNDVVENKSFDSIREKKKPDSSIRGDRFDYEVVNTGDETRLAIVGEIDDDGLSEKEWREIVNNPDESTRTRFEISKDMEGTDLDKDVIKKFKEGEYEPVGADLRSAKTMEVAVKIK